MAPISRRTFLTGFLTCTACLTVVQPSTAQIIQTATWNGTTYHLLAENRWDQSEPQAVALGGHLATINSAAENDFIWNTFGPTVNAIATTGNRSLWIGLNDVAVEGTWVWVSGQPVTYTNWI